MIFLNLIVMHLSAPALFSIISALCGLINRVGPSRCATNGRANETFVSYDDLCHADFFREHTRRPPRAELWTFHTKLTNHTWAIM